MIGIKKIKTLFLLFLTLLLLTEANASWFTHFPKIIKDNQIATIMSISTFILGCICYKFWQENNKKLKAKENFKNCILTMKTPQEEVEQFKASTRDFMKTQLDKTMINLVKYENIKHKQYS